VFIAISFIAQSFCGFGSGMNSVASMAMLSSFTGSTREKYIGYIEAACGIGLLFGPLMGAVAYSIGGYCAPFLFFGKNRFLSF
jgi:MFS family permease